MPSFGISSKEQLASCHPLLQLIFNKVIEHYDCSALEGARSKSRQNFLFGQRKSKVQWPNSKHNKLPSEALDAVPYPVDWTDREQFSHFAGYVKGVADVLGIPIIWGGDWDDDNKVSDNIFDDLGHFELNL